MPNVGSVTVQIERLKAGDPQAAEQLWRRYWRRLAGLAIKHLPPAARRVADEEDIALSAFYRLCKGVERGRFPALDDRENLWKLLASITAARIRDHKKHYTRQKRGGGQVRGESAFGTDESDSDAAGLDQIIDEELTPESVVCMHEECQRLLQLLPSDNHRVIAQLRLEGYANPDIAAELGVALRTVERKLKLIRHMWKQEMTFFQMGSVGFKDLVLHRIFEYTGRGRFIPISDIQISKGFSSGLRLPFFTWFNFNMYRF